jgi:glucose-1-phosphate cytidylyltransferase
MKVVILAGGFGTRLSEVTGSIPKPMVEIGGRPILWHIMNIYAHHGFTEFILALGYKQEVIKEYFINYFAHQSDLTVDLEKGKTKIQERKTPDWKIHLVDTGMQTQTGGRLKRLKNWIGNDTFLMTYGDGVGNVDISALVNFHKKQKKAATLTAVRPPARFGSLVLDGAHVLEFSEKNQSNEGWINGGFFVLEPEVIDLIPDDQTAWEKIPLEQLAKKKQLSAFLHSGFWQPMDTLRDQRFLESIWESKQAPWKIWKDND